MIYLQATRKLKKLKPLCETEHINIIEKLISISTERNYKPGLCNRIMKIVFRVLAGNLSLTQRLSNDFL